MKTVDKILEDAATGKRVTEDEVLLLLNEKDILKLGYAANKIRERFHSDKIVTYIVDRNINYTNICSSGCKFCAFYRRKSDQDGYLITESELDQKIIETKALGGNQILLQGGLHPDLDISWYEDLFKNIKAKHQIHLHALSAPEIVNIAKLSSLSIEQVLIRLQAAGLDSIPGAGAEILVDRVRNKISKGKATVNEWIEVMRIAHNLGIKSSATMMFGHEESLRERIESLRRLRELQDENPLFTAFILWPLQPDNTDMDCYPKVNGFEFLKNLAVARIYLDNFKNIQTSWVTQGEKIAQLSLLYGANDFGSTMIEENVVKAAGVSFRLKEKDIVRLIKEIGFIPRRRSMDYSLLN